MADIAELTKIIEATPENQAIMIVGIHGKGKSEIVESIFTKKGYRMVTIFGGQAGDAGDVIGLPGRNTIKVNITENGKNVEKEVNITEFCPPKWWPFNQDDKVVIFLDEFKRAKEEIHACFMDMILNRKLNGYNLPKHTRVIAADNPSGDDYNYDVKDINPALMDRFNVYEFVPTVEEWVDWASKNKVNKWVIGFITRNQNYLDPPDAKNIKTDQVYPSRRSWKRVSDILNNNEQLFNDRIFLSTLLMGIIGIAATSKFLKYLEESKKELTAGKMLTDWDESVEKAIASMTTPEKTHFNRQIIEWFNGHTKLLDAANKKEAAQYTYNLEKYLKRVPAEVMAEFYDLLSQENCKGKAKWPEKILSLNEGLSKGFISRLNGEDFSNEKSEEDLQKEIDNITGDETF